MRRTLVMAAVTLALSAAAFGQSSSSSAKLRRSENALIAVSRKYVESAIAKDVVIATDNLTPTPWGLMHSAEVSGRWGSVVLAEPVVRIDGNRAVVSGRVVFKGRPIGDQTMNQSSDVRIWYMREATGWKLINLCLGACSAN